MATELLPNNLWSQIEPLLPSPRPPTSKGGRPPADDRRALRGIIYILKSGIPWQALPVDLFGVSGSTCWKRLNQWSVEGRWPKIHRTLLDHMTQLTNSDMSDVSTGSEPGRQHIDPLDFFIRKEEVFDRNDLLLDLLNS